MNSLYGVYEQVSADYIVAGAKMKLGIRDSSEDDLYLKDLVNQGVKRLRNLGTFIPAIAQLEIVDFKAKLPEGFVKFNHPFPIVYVDELGNGVTRGATAPMFINNAFYTNSPFQTTPNGWYWGGTVTLNDGYLFFSTDVQQRWVKIAYLSTNVDIDGEVVIPAIAEDCLTAFVCWQYCRTYFEKYGAVMGSYENEWKRGKQHLKGIFNGTQGYDTPLISYLMTKTV